MARALAASQDPVRAGRGRRAIARVLAAALLLSGAPAVASGPASLDCRTAPINERHIFEGEVNPRGRLVGFHHAAVHRERLLRVLRGPNAVGVYEAEFRAFGLFKRSTFFPDAWTRERVLAAIREACAAAGAPRNGRLIGRTRDGLRIQMYLDGRGGIATAFPLYEGPP